MPLQYSTSSYLPLFIEEALAHHGWKGLTKFDYNDLKSVVVASSMGGSAIANRVAEQNKQRGKRWIADSRDDDVGKLMVRLVDHHDKGMSLIMQDQDDMLSQQAPVRRMWRAHRQLITFR